MAATDMYVTTTGAGTKSGLSWANAFDLAAFETDVETLVEAGDRYFIKEGSYSVAATINTSRSGTVTLPIEIIGVASGTTAEPPTSSDWATGTARPLLTASLFVGLSFALYYMVRNIRVSSQHTTGFYCNAYARIINCYFENTSASDYTTFSAGGSSFVFDCEIKSTNGKGLYLGTHSSIVSSYIHDCGGSYGLSYGGSVVVNHCIIDNCVVGIKVYSVNSTFILNSTIYNCTSGIQFVSNIPPCMINCVIDNCTTGFSADLAGVVNKSGLFNYNNWSNNTKDISWDNGSTEDNSIKGLNDTSVAPAFTNAAGGDFSLDSASGLIDAGFSIELGVG